MERKLKGYQEVNIPFNLIVSPDGEIWVDTYMHPRTSTAEKVFGPYMAIMSMPEEVPKYINSISLDAEVEKAKEILARYGVDHDQR